MKCPYHGTECDAGPDCNERIGCWYLRTLTPETKRGERLAYLQWADFEWIRRGRDLLRCRHAKSVKK
jgi:hypothetical protein